MKIRHLRWWIMFTCFLATTINYIDRQCLSVAAPLISREFHLSNTDYSSIVMSFMVAYTIMQTVFGRITDYVGTRLGMALSIVLWSVAGALHALGNGLWSFRIFRFLLGMGEAGNWPAATKAVSEWFPARERALAVAVFDNGSSAGGILAPPLVVWIIHHFGWRPAFAFTGLLGFLWLALWLRVYRTPEEHPAITGQELQMILSERARDEPSPKRSGSLTGLLRLPAVWGVMSGRFLTDSVWWFYVYWLPKYLVDQRGFTLTQIAALVWIPFLAVGFGNFGGGWSSDYLIRRGFTLNFARKSVMLIGVLGMVAGIPAGLTRSALLCVALIAVATFFYSAWGTIMLTLPSDLLPSGAVASVSGLSGMAAGIGGVLSSWVIGRVVDRFSYRPVFVFAGLMPLLAIALVQALIPDIRKVEKLPN